MKTDWNIGDTTYCYSYNHQGELSEGKIVAILDLDGWSYKHYVIEIPTSIDTILVVRDALTMAESKDGEIGFRTLLRKKVKNEH